MSKTGLLALAVLLAPAYAFAVDGQTLINQSTVTAAGGFPYTISQPGSYKLSGNLSVPVTATGIIVTASNVTLDLNGFSIMSVDASTSSLLVQTVGAVKAFTIRNGTLSVASPNSTLIITDSASSTVAEDLNLVQLSGAGSVFFGSSSIIRRVSYPGGFIHVTCPGLLVDSLAAHYVLGGTANTCAIGFLAGAIP